MAPSGLRELRLELTAPGGERVVEAREAEVRVGGGGKAALDLLTDLEVLVEGEVGALVALLLEGPGSVRDVALRRSVSDGDPLEPGPVPCSCFVGPESPCRPRKAPGPRAEMG